MRVVSPITARPRTPPDVGGRKDCGSCRRSPARPHTPPGVGTPLRASGRSAPPANTFGEERRAKGEVLLLRGLDKAQDRVNDRKTIGGLEGEELCAGLGG